MKNQNIGTVFFIGAGPGDPELITLKGQRLISSADVILYAGSLVSAEILTHASPNAEIHNSAGMKLEQQVALMSQSARQGKTVARLHTGDPSIYGAIDEQMKELDKLQIPYHVIPGVSSAFAAAAALGLEYTLPDITQTLILTRMSGRTPVPELENLRGLAAHRSSLVIFLSTGLLREVVDELRAAGYSAETPIALVYRASWSDQRIVRGTLADIAEQAERGELTHQSLIIVSPGLESLAPPASHLYGGFQDSSSQRKGTAILTLTVPAMQLGRKLLTQFPAADLYIPERLLDSQSAQPNIHPFRESIRQVLQSAFTKYESLICIMAAGIVAREIAPLLKNKHSDPAVVVMDADGKFAVSLLSGHEGGANHLAAQIAKFTGGQAVITTASDVQKIPALDVLAKERGWKLNPKSQLAAVMAALVNGEAVGIVHDGKINELMDGEIPNGIFFPTWEKAQEKNLQALTLFTIHEPPAQIWSAFAKVVVYHPASLVVGVGCNRNTPAEEIIEAIETTLRESNLSLQSVACLSTVTAKADEAGLLQAAREKKWNVKFVAPEQIEKIQNLPNPSPYAQKALGVQGVAEPSALWVAESQTLLVEKRKFQNVTVAVALKEKTI